MKSALQTSNNIIVCNLKNKKFYIITKNDENQVQNAKTSLSRSQDYKESDFVKYIQYAMSQFKKKTYF